MNGLRLNLAIEQFIAKKITYSEYVDGTVVKVDFGKSAHCY